MRSALFCILLGTLLCGCGQKGPLFIPDGDAPAANDNTPAANSTPQSRYTAPLLQADQ